MLVTAFAQKTFKPIHYTMIFNGANKTAAQGEIKINLKDSTITVADSPVKKFKIIAISPDENAIDENKVLQMWVDFLCDGSDGTSCTIRVVRAKEPNGVNILNVQLTYSSGDPVIYDCDYMQEIYAD